MQILPTSNYSQNRQIFTSKTSEISTELIKNLIASGKTTKEIRAELGLANDTYYKLLRERGIEYKRQKKSTTTTPNVTKEQLTTLLNSGLTIPQMCEKLKVRLYTFLRLLEDFGLKTQSKILREKSSQVTKEKLEEAVNSGLSIPEICERFEITTSVYYSLISKFNIQTEYKKLKRQLAEITKEQIMALQAAGKRYSEIIRELNISSTAYNGLCARFGLVSEAQKAKQHISTITKEKIISLIEAGKSRKEIQSELQINERTYTRLLNKFGIITDRKKVKQNAAKITKESLQEMVDTGFTVQQIGNYFGINKATIYRIFKILKINYDYVHHSGEIKIPKEVLEEAANSGKTVKEIAEELKIAGNTYNHKAKEAGVKTVFRDSIDKLASITVQELQDLLNQGYTKKEICEKYALTVSNYKALLQKYNLETPHRKSMEKNSKITKEIILETLKTEKSVEAVCEKLNISKSSYYRIMRDPSRN